MLCMATYNLEVYMKEELLLLKVKKLDNDIMKKLSKYYNIKLKGITATQVQIIKYISSSKEKVYQKDIERFLGLTRATTSGVLKTMERHGLIEKKDNLLDARSKEIILKDPGEKLLSKAEKILYSLEDLILKDISNEDRELFFEVINKINNNINKEDEICLDF